MDPPPYYPGLNQIAVQTNDMSYQALARKWRPRQFADVVGQEHVIGALANSLDSERVHHAFLFSGTRGVGKTTIARILAKALNCEQGVSSTPCDQCSSCQSVDEGRFIDLIEVDAASRTKVDDTRELLDNVQYAPTRGRFKVYLIDEVHMLSGHSFNALLKTLEEPPPHVKFLLATTDPQKLPVTVLSRCLQFNLKALQAEQICAQLTKVLEQENIEFDRGALDLLARSAYGSMRDALSLLDQAISHGGGSVSEVQVRDMLGMIDETYVFKLLENLQAQDADGVLGTVEAMAQRAVDYAAALDDLLLQLHNLSLMQIAPKAALAKSINTERISELAQRYRPEEVQLFYQIALIGKRDLPLAPDARAGFEMVLLRMLAFNPEGNAAAVDSNEQTVGRTSPSRPQVNASSDKPRVSTPGSAAPALPNLQTSYTASNLQVNKTQAVAQVNEVDGQAPHATPGESSIEISPLAEQWHGLIIQPNLKGLVKELAMNVSPMSLSNGAWSLRLETAHRHFLSKERQAMLVDSLSKVTGDKIVLEIELGESDHATPAQIEAHKAAQRQQQVVDSMENDANVQELIDRFNATVIPDSIRPRD